MSCGLNEEVDADDAFDDGGAEVNGMGWNRFNE